MTPFRRFIRVDGKVFASPQFTRRSDANEWYREMLKKKDGGRRGISYKTKTPFIDYARQWMDYRQENYPASTWKSDEQRLRDYVLPHWADMPIESITRQHVHSLLRRASDQKLSKQTLVRIKALVSVIFSDAMNEEPPLVEYNPAHGVVRKEKRKGKYKPKFLESRDECLRFIAAAKELGDTHFLIATTLLMTGMRKQELIALRWLNVSLDKRSIQITHKLQQATNTVVRGTKAGEETARAVPIPGELVEVLRLAWSACQRTGMTADCYVIGNSLKHVHARKVSRMVEEIQEKAGVNITAHGLRHTYGREFAMATGNTKALQAILGHSSSATTDIYSNLGDERVKGFGEAVSFETGVKNRHD